MHFESYGIHAHGGRAYACMRYDISMFTCAAHGRNALRAPYAPTSTEPAAGCKWGGRKDWGRGIAHSSNGSPRLQVGHHRDHRQEAGAGPHRAQTRSRHLSPKALPYGKSKAPEAPCERPRNKIHACAVRCLGSRVGRCELGAWVSEDWGGLVCGGL